MNEEKVRMIVAEELIGIKNGIIEGIEYPFPFETYTDETVVEDCAKNVGSVLRIEIRKRVSALIDQVVTETITDVIKNRILKK